MMRGKEKSFPGRRNSKCKGPELVTSLGVLGQKKDILEARDREKGCALTR